MRGRACDPMVISRREDAGRRMTETLRHEGLAPGEPQARDLPALSQANARPPGPSNSTW